MPVLRSSGILLSRTRGTDRRQGLSNAVPTRYIVAAVRDAFAGELASDAFRNGVLVTALLLVAGLWWGTHAFRREEG